MRILAVSHPCVVDVNQQFYAELEKLGNEVQIVVPSNFASDYSTEPIRVRRWTDFRGAIHEYPVFLQRSIPLHTYIASLSRVVRDFDPEVLLVEEEPYSVSAFQSYWATRSRSIVRAVYSAQNIYKRYPFPFHKTEQYVLHRTDIALSISTEVTSVLRKKGYQGQVLDFPLGVDTEQFYPDAQVRAKLRDSMNLREEDFVVGYVGRFVEEKGIRLFIEAARKNRHGGIHYLFIGNGPLMDEIKILQSELGSKIVQLISSVPHSEINSWYNAMDVLVLPSITTPTWKEQFGRVIVEANACQVPVLGSDSGEIPKVIQQTNGGWIFQEGNVESLVSNIESIRRMPDTRLTSGKNGYLSVNEKFSKRQLAVRTHSELNRLLPDAQGGRQL